jgi:uncharacterized repeat protein (TIGR01451 family)
VDYAQKLSKRRIFTSYKNMRILSTPIIQYAAVLAAGIMVPAASTIAHGQTTPITPQVISNTGLAEWDQGPSRLSRPSNTVELQVQAPPATRPTLALFHFSNAPGAGSANIPVTMCMGSGGTVPLQPSGAFSGVSTTPASVVPATAIRAGEPLIIQVDDAAKNANSTAIEQYDVTVVTANGDSERITLVESAANSGRFRGLINTRAAPPAAVQRDCVLSVRPGDSVSVKLDDVSTGNVVGSANVDILIDPFGLTFDSANGTAVDGTRVTIVDVVSGAPAQVFGDDAVSAFPSTLIVGTQVSDSGGQSYAFPQGFYRFPFLRPGTYRIEVAPPAPYTHPSVATPAELALLTRPDGGPFAISNGSYGGTFTLSDPAPVRIDIPLDRPGGSLILRKSTSTRSAVPGDIVQYRIEVQNPDRLRGSNGVVITDRLPAAIRLRANTVRYQGALVTPVVAADGSNFTYTIPTLAAGATGTLTYLAEIRTDAQPGDAINLASARDNRGAVSGTVDAALRITRDGITERFTLIGRVTEGGCTFDPRKALGVAGVRVMLEDGTYTVTDKDGRYHFEGLVPGIHVAQVDPESFPLDQAPIDCARNTRSAGSAISRFVEGRGGSLKRADFRSHTVPPRTSVAADIIPIPQAISDKEAAGADRDWISGQAVGTGFVFPETGYNPRIKAIRVAFKHTSNQTVELSLNGVKVNALNYDGVKKNADGSVQVRVWRGIDIIGGINTLTAKVMDESGAVIETIQRTVYFAHAPVQAQFIKELSVLRADGVTRPRIAVRLTDRNGKPIQHDAIGDFSVSDPYRPAVEADAQQAAQLSGLERARPVWRVHGDDGVAYIELEPTTASGTVNVGFNFLDGKVQRKQNVEFWLDPGQRPWTVVGFAAGTIGFNKLNDSTETLAKAEDDINVDGRIALYAKGRVSGKWLMTLAYDTDKKTDQTRFAGVIDPRQYYTIYADRAEQRYDASSLRRLYLKLERPQFYALFGDYQTGIDEPELARYQRSFNGIKAEYRSEQVSAQVFGADTPYRYRREEIQGNGTTGPYALGSRDVIANSERIRLQIRDRLRSDRIVEERDLLRHIDYDIDYLAGTLRFRDPILSRSSGLDPQFILAEYEVDGVGKRVNNAGGRIRWSDKSKKFQIGATAIHDETDVSKTNLIGADITYRPAAGTEIRAEFAGSDGKANNGAGAPDAGRANAWLLEAEHHTGSIDVRAYARQQASGFGVGQNNSGAAGTRKVGVDARARINDNLSVSAIGYQEDYLQSNARRRAGITEAEYRSGATTLRAGIAHASDTLADGTINKSTIAKIGGAQKLLNNKLELSAQTEFALGGQDASIDFPARHQIGARYAVTNDVNLIAGYEIAKGDKINARTARLGFDVAPWAGGRILASANKQDITEFGPRTFAAYGLAQSFKINDKWSADISVDGNKTLSGVQRSSVLNPLQPVASGGFLGSDGSLTEDFTAVTAGATYRGDRYSWTGRAEYRAGETTDRYGFNTAILRQIGEGKAITGALSWFSANQRGGPSTETAQAEISWANRPAASDWSFLNKFELRYDAVKNAVAGLSGPIGGAALNINGDAQSRRVINSLSINYTPIGRDENGLGLDKSNYFERGEYGLFWGSRYVSEKFGNDDVSGWSNVIGADFRLDMGEYADFGAQATVRVGTGGRNVAYSGGPVLTVTPAKNMNISLGYNVTGFADRDFEASRYMRSGPFVTLKLKFDQESLAGLKR